MTKIYNYPFQIYGVEYNRMCYVCKKLKITRKEYCENISKYNPPKIGKKVSSVNSSRKQTLELYGLTPEDYQLMFNNQNGVCAICKKPESVLNKTGTVRNLAVDHCHITGKVRGLLCTNCNIALGKFQDDKNLLRDALSYLEVHNFV